VDDPYDLTESAWRARFSRCLAAARVLEALDLEPRPPHPEGYATVEGDLSLLEPVRRRGRKYREGLRSGRDAGVPGRVQYTPGMSVQVRRRYAS
jgi:hypothetical protein